jgi:diacylglycerol kinase family enzyme
VNPSRRIGVVINPTKFDDLDDVKDRVAKVCAEHGWGEPIFVETTEEDPGVGQCQEALDRGVDIVCPLGGDGTVRAVATTLVGTDTPMGLLPGGTGNLLARNLDLPVDELEDALEVVLTGRDRRIDVGLVHLFPDSDSAETLKGDEPATADDPRHEDEEVFLVMAGIGVDAEVMARTNEKVKGILGWPAYVFAGIGRLFTRGFMVNVSSGGGDPQVQHARSVIVGNCGSLQGNLDLMPDAKLDDGILDGVILAPKGAFGWGAVAADLASRHRRGHRQIVRLTSTAIRVTTGNAAIDTQIDGDPKGEQHGLTTRVLPKALVVRVS